MGSRGASAALNLSPAQLEKKSISAGIGALGIAKALYKEKNGKEGTPEQLSAFLDEEKDRRTNERISEIVRRLDTDDYKSIAERDKLRAEYSRLNSERTVASIRRFNRRNNIKDVWQ